MVLVTLAQSTAREEVEGSESGKESRVEGEHGRKGARKLLPERDDWSRGDWAVRVIGRDRVGGVGEMRDPPLRCESLRRGQWLIAGYCEVPQLVRVPRSRV